ncbi:CLUMA_CG002375, isoform A [Clunio marinus]|uniref:CLUMA_CG002375, isoform A n=1 Tax=Clunio marinus TaxID=568069 RepID=A0A1J1HL67_9DIPT|nr:CLUMA_CG002375, isoform A [Clunio marinus]
MLSLFPLFILSHSHLWFFLHFTLQFN